jgi:hypothetical protein
MLEDDVALQRLGLLAVPSLARGSFLQDVNLARAERLVAIDADFGLADGLVGDFKVSRHGM